MTRVTCSMTRKYNVAQYESIDIHIGLEDDVQVKENVDEAFNRVEKQVYVEWKKLCDLIETRYKKGGKK